MAAILPLHLPDHLSTLFLSTACFAVIHHLIAPEFAGFLLGKGKKGWDALGSRERAGWCVLFIFFFSSYYDMPNWGCFWLDTEYLGNRAWHRSFTR